MTLTRETGNSRRRLLVCGSGRRTTQLFLKLGSRVGFAESRLKLLYSPSDWKRMNLKQAMDLIKQCTDHMDALYHKVVFDEWAVISLGERDGKVLGYLGPRKDDFQKSFLNDVGALRAELRKAKPVV